MSRPLRLEHPGALWHVTSRGNEKQPIYRDDLDRQIWLRLLGRVVVELAWRLHGYVMMNNHYHLIAETPVPSLSRGMRQLNGVYTQSFNRRHARVGHLFQGRFHSVLVQKDSHLLELLRYAVLNPVRAGLVDSPAEWRWSSYRYTAGEVSAPVWLDTAWTLAQFGGGQRRYREFVAEGQGVPVIWRELRGQIYLGSDSFVEESRGQAQQRTDAREIPQAQRQMSPLPAEQVLERLCAAFGVSLDQMNRHPRRYIRERAVIAYALRRFAGLTGVGAAAMLEVNPWHASKLARAGEAYWASDVRLASSIENALQGLV